jgi:hypothetical protein
MHVVKIIYMRYASTVGGRVEPQMLVKQLLLRQEV